MSSEFSQHIDMGSYMVLCDTLRMRRNESILDAARRVVRDQSGAVACAQALIDALERDSSQDGQWLAIIAAAKIAQKPRLVPPWSRA